MVSQTGIAAEASLCVITRFTLCTACTRSLCSTRRYADVRCAVLCIVPCTGSVLPPCRTCESDRVTQLQIGLPSVVCRTPGRSQVASM